MLLKKKRHPGSGNERSKNRKDTPAVRELESAVMEKELLPFATGRLPDAKAGGRNQ